MTTALIAMPDAPDPRHWLGITRTLCLGLASVSLFGLGLYLLIRTWVGAVAH